MFKKKFYLLTLVLFFSLLNGCVPQSTHLKAVDETKRFKQISEDKEKYIENLKTELAKAKAKTEKTEELYKKQNEHIRNLEGELAAIKAKTGDLEKEIAESEREIAIREQLVESLKTEIRQGKVEITKVADQTHIRLKDAILFDLGKAKLKPGGIKMLKKIGEQLKTIQDRQILIEGHTDNIPIKPNSVYSSNLELSASRAMSVANHQIKQTGIPKERIVILAYGEHRPIAENSTPEGRRKNRRVTIVLAKLSEILGDSK